MLLRQCPGGSNYLNVKFGFSFFFHLLLAGLPRFRVFVFLTKFIACILVKPLRAEMAVQKCTEAVARRYMASEAEYSISSVFSVFFSVFRRKFV